MVQCLTNEHLQEETLHDKEAMALARRYLEQDEIDIIFFPEFVDVEIEGKTRTAIRFSVELR